jgi:hypothetical protein
VSVSKSHGASKDVYVLQHSYQDAGCAETKMIGIYRLREEAEAAIIRLKLQPGFRDFQDDFHIDRYPLDLDHWSEGFTREVRGDP